MSYWWDNSPKERYWVEITDRKDVGADLHCPQVNEASKAYWSYSLINEIWAGDLVFHYSTRTKEIVGASVAGTPLEERPTLWIPHGTIGRSKSKHVVRPGWWLPIFGYTDMGKSLSLSELREQRNTAWVVDWIENKRREIKRRRKAGEKALDSAVAAPFQKYGKTLRGQQGYLTKMPVEFIDRWSQLSELIDALSLEQERLNALNETFPLHGPISEEEDAAFNPKNDEDYVAEIRGGLQRRTRKHERLVKDAARLLTAYGATVSNPHPIDLMISAPLKVIIEAKIVPSSPLYSVRLATGQLHEYRYFFKHKGAKLCILIDQRPDDSLVQYVEEELKLMIAWVTEGQLQCGVSTSRQFTESGMKMKPS